MYQPYYAEGRALIIGINRYQRASPLGVARQDAEAVSETLIRDFAFRRSNVCMLLDGDATRGSILEAFFALRSSVPDDRVVVFFAGHGHT